MRGSTCVGTWFEESFDAVHLTEAFGLTATDPLTYAAAALLLATVALLAAVVPARRAARLDPTVSLRSE